MGLWLSRFFRVIRLDTTSTRQYSDPSTLWRRIRLLERRMRSTEERLTEAKRRADSAYTHSSRLKGQLEATPSNGHIETPKLSQSPKIGLHTNGLKAGISLKGTLRR
jgi:hypothetical protein